MGSRRPSSRLPHSLLQTSSTFKFSEVLRKLFFRLQERESTSGRTPHPSSERVRGACTSRSRLLQQDVCSSESYRRIPSSHRLVNIEPFHPDNTISYGNELFSYDGHPSRGLDVVSGSEGCLFPGPYPSKQQEVPSVHVGTSTFPVQGSMFRLVHCSPGLHQSDGSSFGCATQEGHSTAAIPGRLACSSFLRRGGLEVEANTVGPLYFPQHHCQLGKVHSYTQTKCDFPGDGNPLKGSCRVSIPEEDHQPSKHYTGLPRPGFSFSTGLADPPRPSFISSPSCPGGSKENEKSSVPPCGPLEQTPLWLRLSSAHLPGGSARHSVVVNPFQPSSGSVLTYKHPRSGPLHGCFIGGLGSLSPRRRTQWHLVEGRSSRTHLPFRTKGCQAGSPNLRVPPTRENRGCNVRQHHSTLLLTEGRRDTVSHPQSGGTGDPSVGRGQLRLHLDTVRSRPEQRSGRRPQQKEPGVGHGVDATPPSLHRPMETLGLSPPRPVCHTAEQQTAQLCVSLPGSSSGCDGCISFSVGSQGNVCLPSFCHSEEGNQQTPLLKRDQADPDRTFLATKRVVPRSGVYGNNVSTQTSSQERPSTATALPSVPPQSPRATVSRVETVKRLLRFRGYSRGVSQAVAESRRNSTNLNYQSKWKTYRQWCLDAGHSVSRPSSQKFADFILFLHRTRHLSASAIKGYKAMLNSVFSLKGFDLSQDLVLTNLIKSIETQTPRKSVGPPSWNLDVVLRALSQPPFEPLRSASFRDLTKKSLFLVSLATAKRVSELQALSRRVASQGEDLLLSYLPEFLAKTERAYNLLPREFRLKSLAPLVGSDDEERLLCPVRALNYILERTKGISPKPRNLFVSPSNNSKPLSKNALSFLLKETILQAHQAFPEELQQPLRVRAHDIRGIATSLNLCRNHSFNSILEAASWKTPSVFANHYLKDLERIEGDTFSLGPIVAAGDIVL